MLHPQSLASARRYKNRQTVRPTPVNKLPRVRSAVAERPQSVNEVNSAVAGSKRINTPEGARPISRFGRRRCPFLSPLLVLVRFANPQPFEIGVGFFGFLVQFLRVSTWLMFCWLEFSNPWYGFYVFLRGLSRKQTTRTATATAIKTMPTIKQRLCHRRHRQHQRGYC